MDNYFVAEEGPLAGMVIAFAEATEESEWTLGRDPDTCDVVLEDPMVSRRHVTIRFTPEGFTLENLSSVNPATQNGMVIADSVLLKEGDIIQIGSTFFHFTEKVPDEPKPEPVAEDAPPEEEGSEAPSELHFGPSPDTRWLLKVISGPNAGAEFAMRPRATYLIGKDPNICDIVFQDLSVSKEHARLSLDGDENVFIEDLGSRNGVIINGELIDDKHLVSSEDLIALGTTTFLVVDRTEARETIVSPPVGVPSYPKPEAEKPKEKKDWKEMRIPKRHLVIAATFGVVIFAGVYGMLALFRTEPVTIAIVDETGEIRKTLDHFEGVEFSFNRPSGKLFLIGNVMTMVEHQEMLYLLREIPFITQIEDNVIIDELVWQNMNSLLSTNPDWVGVSMYGPSPGEFILRGYVDTSAELEELIDYVNQNFDYLDRLRLAVVVEKNLQTEVASRLVEHGFAGVSFELFGGELVLSGMVEEKESAKFRGLINDFREIPGIRMVKDFVVTSIHDSSRVDLSKEFAVTGYSKGDEGDIFVVINGRILEKGDRLDGMMITQIKPRSIFLEKEGMKYKIDYNLQ